MIVTAWNNGKHHQTGAGYGFKISVSDRNSNFKKSWRSVVVTLPSGEEVEANINKESFWSSTCRELISREFGVWLRGNGLAPWQKGKPPKFKLVHTSANKFDLM